MSVCISTVHSSSDIDSGIKIENAVPPIVSVELFNGVQIEIAKNAHAPARHTADDDYLLTTKLFCGKCGAMMVAQAGTSKTGKVHRYYACVRQKKHKCDKKMLPKEKFEEFIVYKTMAFLQQDGTIEKLSEMLFNLQHTESSLLPRLEEQHREKEKEIENIVNAITKGYATDTLLKRLGELEAQRDEISVSIAKEKIKSPIFTQDHFRMGLYNFRKVDISKQDGKRKIIDTFINAIFVYDDSFKIVYNGNGKEETISLEELESSTLFSQGAPEKNGKFRKKFAVFFNEARLRRMKNEAGLRPMKRAVGTLRGYNALHFIFAKQMLHTSVASASYRRSRCFINTRVQIHIKTTKNIFLLYIEKFC